MKLNNLKQITKRMINFREPVWKRADGKMDVMGIKNTFSFCIFDLIISKIQKFISKNYPLKLFDNLGMILFICLSPVPFLALPSTIVAIFLGYDLYRFFLEDLWEFLGLQDNLWISVIDILIRLFLTYVAVAEGGRSMQFLVLCVGLPTLQFFGIIHHFLEIANKLRGW